MDEGRLRQEVSATYEAYLRAFLANDVAAIDAVIRYPLAYIGVGEVRMFDSYPVKPAELMAAKQWDHSTSTGYEVVAVSSDKAHVVLPRAHRRRADSSLIETVSAFYAFTRTADGWKMFAFSDVTVPASA